MRKGTLFEVGETRGVGAENRPRIRGGRGAETGARFDLPFIPSRYAVSRELGRGGMGVVYLARDTRMGRQVAIKVLSPHSSTGGGEDDASRFRREAKELASLTHPNIVALLDSGESQDRQYMVMEYVEGGNLRTVLEKADLPSILGIFIAICEGLEYIHSRGIVHRDLKPDNILMTAQGQPKITDFGLVRRIEQQSSRHTQAGSILGTGSYLPPEQIMSNEVGPRADLYSLGVCLFQACTGRLPFIEEQEFKLLQHHIKTPPPVPSQIKPGLHPKLDELILRLLAKLPEQRPQSAAETAGLLQEVLGLMGAAVIRTIEVAPVTLVGRGGDLEELAKLAAAESDGAALLLVAPAGVGRSAVLHRLSKDLGALSSRRVVWLGPGTAEVVLGSLWQELGRPPDEPLSLREVGGDAAMAAALVRLLTAQTPTVLLVDDFERLDSLTQRMLVELYRRTPPSGVLWLVSLTPRQRELFPQQVRSWSMEALKASSLQLLDKAWLGLEPGPRLSQFLQQRAPSLQARRLWLSCLRATGALVTGELSAAPAGELADLAMALLRQQAPEVREAAGLAACLQEPVEVALLQGAASNSQSLSAGLGVLCELGVLSLCPDRSRVAFTLPGLREQLRTLTSRPPVHLRLAQALESRGARAELACHLALAGQPGAAQGLAVQAERLTQSGYYLEAFDLWKLAGLLGAGPEQAVARCQMARCRAELGAATAAIEELRPLLNGPNRAQVQWTLARALILAGRPEEAQATLGPSAAGEDEVRRLELLAELAPGPEQAAELLESALQVAGAKVVSLSVRAAQYYLAAGLAEKALPLLSSLAEQKSGSWGGQALRLAGECHLALQQPREAMASFQQALQDVAGLPAAWEAELRLGLSRACEQNGDLPNASRACQEAVKLLRASADPELPRAMISLARLQRASIQYYDAERTLRDVPDGGGNLQLGLLLMAQNRPSEALAFLEGGLSDEGEAREQVEVLCALTAAYVSRQKDEDATRVAQLAVTRARGLGAPWPAAARVACARAALGRRDWSEAADHLRAAGNLAPSPELSKEIEQLQKRLPASQATRTQPVPVLEPQHPSEEEETETSPGPRRGLLVAGVVALVGLCLAGLLFSLTGLEVITTPPGALVIVSGRPVGRSPLKSWAMPGTVELWVRLDGFLEVRKSVQVWPGRRQRINLALEKRKKK